MFLTQKWPDLRGCISFAPTVDLKAKLADLVAPCEKAGIPMGAYLAGNSPAENRGKLKCPLLLFYARDDKPVVAALNTYANALRQEQRPAEIKVANEGGHYDSMIAEGIPAGIAWVKAREKQ